MKNEKKKEITCRMGGVRDLNTGRIYTEEEIKRDPELKAYIEKRMNININRAFGLI